MRLDKYLVGCDLGDKQIVKKYIKGGYIKVNNQIIKDSGYNVSLKDTITNNDQLMSYFQYRYLILNKPPGFVCSTKDRVNPTVIDLITSYPYRQLAPVGRLDKDTTGMLLISDDGQFIHEMTSPKKHLEKTYLVSFEGDLTDKLINDLENGIILSDGYLTKKALVEVIDLHTINLIICEGKYHQVKRMMAACGLILKTLKRVKIGNLNLPAELQEGQYRNLTSDEIKRLKTLSS